MKELFIIGLVTITCFSFCFAAEIKENKLIEVQLGQNFTITLESNPTAGYAWQTAESIDKNMIQLIGSEYLQDKIELKHIPENSEDLKRNPKLRADPNTLARLENSRMGRGGKEVWTFKALKAGRTAISFQYVRPWEKNIPPVKEKTFTVIIKEQ
jgi:inhibitor of cysteine peptidase